jgi:hypothetical protein
MSSKYNLNSYIDIIKKNALLFRRLTESEENELTKTCDDTGNNVYIARMQRKLKLRQVSCYLH